MAKTKNTEEVVPKAKRPGLYDATGEIQNSFPAFEKGLYAVEVDSFEPTTTKTENAYEMHKIKLVILSGEFEDREYIDSVIGKFIFDNIILPDYDDSDKKALDWYTKTINQLKNFLNAAGVKVKKDGTFDHKDAVGKKIWVDLLKVSKKDPDTKKPIEGEFENRVKSYYADEDEE